MSGVTPGVNNTVRYGSVPVAQDRGTRATRNTRAGLFLILSLSGSLELRLLGSHPRPALLEGELDLQARGVMPPGYEKIGADITQPREIHRKIDNLHGTVD